MPRGRIVISRRSFLKYTAAGSLALYLPLEHGGARAVAAIPGGTLDPARITKFVDALPIPGVMPRQGPIKQGNPRRVDRYAISVRQFRQQMLSSGLPQTTVWGFGPADRRDLHATPSLTIETDADVPVEVTWINDLVDDSGKFLPHLLPVDPTLHWANPAKLADAKGRRETDQRPAMKGLKYVPPQRFTDPATQYTTYQGPVPFVTHLHGAMRVGDESDGYTEAWYLPDAKDIPADYARHGTWFEFFAAKYQRQFGARWEPGKMICHYPNGNRAAALWFHDHVLGMTRLNVYAGPVGFFLIRGGAAGDDKVTDARTGRTAVLPGPAPRKPQGNGPEVREVPLAIQDRSFNADGSLFYPDTRAFFDDFEGPFLPESDVSPLWNPEFFGNTLIVNGKTWPRLEVEQRRYRFRVLNGCQSRFLILDFGKIPGAEVWAIGNDGGFLPKPACLERHALIAPAERLDLIVDFTKVPVGQHVLGNVGPDEPYGGGEPGKDFEPADPASTGNVMRFDVVACRGADNTTPPQHLVMPRLKPEPAPVRTVKVALMEHTSTAADGPHAAMLGVVDAAGMAKAVMWDDPITENPKPGTTEVWEIYNFTEDAHPVHIHETAFEVVNRQRIEVHEHHVKVDREAPVPPHPIETGHKDTVTAYPHEVTRIALTFVTAGQYVWHCHVLEHEDNEMMRPYRIGPVQPGQPE